MMVDELGGVSIRQGKDEQEVVLVLAPPALRAFYLTLIPGLLCNLLSMRLSLLEASHLQ